MSSFSLKKRERILKRSLFLNIGKKGSKVRTRHFIVLYMPNSLNITRIGITVSKKIGSAVKRNRVKRLIREFFRSKKQSFLTSLDCVFIAGRGSQLLNYEELTKELIDSLTKNGIIRAHNENCSI